MWTEDRKLREIESDRDYYRNLYEQAQRDREAEQERRQREQRAERMAMYEERAREWKLNINDWRQAIREQARLCRREANMFPGDPDSVDDFFRDSADACEMAARIYDEELDYAADSLEQIERQMAALEAQREGILVRVRHTTGCRLRQEGNTSGWRAVADELAHGEMTPGEWLDW